MRQVNTALTFPSEDLHEAWNRGEYHEGATEPWTVQAVSSLMAANFSRTVLELGVYKGHTSEWLCHTLDAMGETTFHGVDLHDDVIEITRQRLDACNFKNVAWTIYQGDAIAFLKQCEPMTYDFAWVDDDHVASHVAQELELLLPLMKPRGIICMHDVVGTFDLDLVCQRFHGYALEFPRIHVAGGLGIIQVQNA